VATLKERVDKHDREIAAIKTLIKAGMRLVVQTQQQQLENERLGREVRKELKALATAQRRTEQSLDAFINSMRGRGSNGHGKPA
jgi:hypothetical protein